MIKAIITDIEGTTTSLSFVKDVLFPYSRDQIGDYVLAHQDEPAVRKILSEVRRESGLPADTDTAGLIELMKRWIDLDRKSTPLKALQGLIWDDGYQRGAFYGHLYPDAVENLKDWRACGLELYIYSSGSVHAQKLLFANTDYGDLTPLFSGYFDTRIGGKKEPESYRKIAEQLPYPADRLLFLSDSKDELDAARLTGFNTVWLTREHDPDPYAAHQQVRSFDEISISL